MANETEQSNIAQLLLCVVLRLFFGCSGNEKQYHLLLRIWLGPGEVRNTSTYRIGAHRLGKKNVSGCDFVSDSNYFSVYIKLIDNCFGLKHFWFWFWRMKRSWNHFFFSFTGGKWAVELSCVLVYHGDSNQILKRFNTLKLIWIETNEI